MKGFFITGTDTGVGKTEVASYLAKSFSKKGYRVGVMKPVATGVKGISEDGRILKRHTFLQDSTDYINPVSLKLPLAPLVASEIEKTRINLGVIWHRFKELGKNSDMMIVEGIGGLMVPICKRGKKVFYVLDMILKMKLPVILVARPNLGTINHTLLSIKALKNKKIKIKGIIFNYPSRGKNKDLSIKTNPSVIERLTGVKVLAIMYYNRDRSKRRIEWLKRIGV